MPFRPFESNLDVDDEGSDDSKSPLRLSEFTQRIDLALDQSFGSAPIWIVAEIAEIRIASSGHVYFNFVEKQSGKITAKIRGNCWRQTADRIIPAFERQTQSALKEGMEVLFSASLNFHDVYGLAITVNALDANFTLGALAKQKQETIKKLTDEGLLDKNKDIDLPLVLQRVAVISSDTAAGYGDFLGQIEGILSEGLKVNATLFPAMVQGDKAEASIIKQIKAINKSAQGFDVIVIIRGGGASTDMHCFDSYSLCKEIANAKLPILTGIGHDRDESVADMVSHTKLKTPTAVADFIIDSMRSFQFRVLEAKQGLVSGLNRFMDGEKQRLKEVSRDLKALVQAVHTNEKHRLNSLSRQLLHQTHVGMSQVKARLHQYQTALLSTVKHRVSNESNRVDVLSTAVKRASHESIKSQKIRLEQVTHQSLLHSQRHLQKEKFKLKALSQIIVASSPQKILKRGFSVSKLNGKFVKSIKDVNDGDTITTMLVDGVIESKVKSVSKE